MTNEKKNNKNLRVFFLSCMHMVHFGNGLIWKICKERHHLKQYTAISWTGLWLPCQSLKPGHVANNNIDWNIARPRRGANHAARPLGKYFNSRPYPINTVCRQDWYYLVHPATLKMFSLCTLVTLHHIGDFSGGWYHLIETYQFFQRIPSRRVTDFHCSTATAALVFATLHNIAITLTWPVVIK